MFGTDVAVPSGGNAPRRSDAVTWNTTPAGKAPQDVLAQVPELDIGREVVPDELLGRQRQQGLPAVRSAMSRAARFSAGPK